VHNSGLLAQQAFEAGARAFLSKSDANRLLLATVDSLLVHKRFGTESCLNELNGGPGGDVEFRGSVPHRAPKRL
jgi:DNA-binding NarL/FixJ family response regulator